MPFGLGVNTRRSRTEGPLVLDRQNDSKKLYYNAPNQSFKTKFFSS